MDNYLNSYREMTSLRGLTHHTVTSYSTYISAYLDYLSVFLCKDPQDVSWQELRDFIRWLQKARSLSDRTMNAVISQLLFLPSTCSTRHGMIPSFPGAGLTNIFPMSPPRKTPGLLSPPFPILRSRPLSPFCIRLDYVPAKSGI